MSAAADRAVKYLKQLNVETATEAAEQLVDTDREWAEVVSRKLAQALRAGSAESVIHRGGKISA